MDCSTQLASQMTMKDWEDYYFQDLSESGEKKRTLNVISLEFSSTKLDSMVEAPKVVRQIDIIIASLNDCNIDLPASYIVNAPPDIFGAI